MGLGLGFKVWKGHCLDQLRGLGVVINGAEGEGERVLYDLKIGRGREEFLEEASH